MTGRDDKLSSVLVLAQDGRAAPLRTLPPLTTGKESPPLSATRPSEIDRTRAADQEDVGQMIIQQPDGQANIVPKETRARGDRFGEGGAVGGGGVIGQITPSASESMPEKNPEENEEEI